MAPAKFRFPDAQMAHVNVTLPAINGEIEAGLAVGVEAGLPEDSKLQVISTGTKDAMVKFSATWAYQKFSDTPSECRSMYTNAAAVITGCRLFAKVGELHDGDWTYVRQVALGEETPPDGYLRLEEMRRAACIIIATKANYWLMNHHTGQGAVAGYVKKILNVYFGDAMSESMVSCAHTIGHWASTIHILTLAGIQGLKVVTHDPRDASWGFQIAADAKLRFDSFPAGTHKLYVIYTGAKKLVRSKLAKACPGILGITELKNPYAEVSADRASHHVGGKYLTGNNRATADDGGDWLGRVGVFVLRI